MKNNIVDLIANFITEHPDSFNEEFGMNYSNGTELGQRAEQMTNTQAGKDIMSKQLKMQQDIQKKQDNERKKILEPQFKKIDQTTNKLQNGLTQSQANNKVETQRMTGLEKEMADLDNLIGNVKKQV